jgi:D-alanyl-D-alanine carboxypeptidase
MSHRSLSIPILFALGATRLSAQETQGTLAAAQRAGIDSTVREVLARTGTPSASIAVVRDGRTVYLQAYGSARLTPEAPATVSQRYSIGSISKQFTATAVLLLAETGRLSLDDKVGKWLPDLTRANSVSLRQILSMTSGYQDYWPQDYVMPGMLKPTTAEAILAQWARKPLDFEPGTQWQYSNTNYVIAGLIVEKVSGMPLLDFLRRRVFAPLRMESVADIDAGPLGSSDPTGYLRYALGPPRPAPKEAPGWLFAAGELAMTAADLARWDIATLEQAVLKPESYRTMQTDTRLQDGVGTGYGLGVSVAMAGGRRVISHGGEVSGFTARNAIYPDDRTAIVVFTNLDATGASAQIASGIASMLFSAPDVASRAATEQARAIFAELQQGRIDRTRFSANANAYFSAQALADFAASLGPLGAVHEFVQVNQGLRGGMVSRVFRIRVGQKVLSLTTFTLPDGKLEQYQIAAT